MRIFFRPELDASAGESAAGSGAAAPGADAGAEATVTAPTAADAAAGASAAATAGADAGAGASAAAAAPEASLGTDEGRLEVVGGAAKVRIYADASITGLYEVHAEGPEPGVSIANGRIRVQVSRGFLAFDWRSRSIELALNPSVPWRIELNGGAWKVRADLTELHLRELSVSGGASDLELDLPAPREVVPVRLNGGATKLTILRPAGVPARVVMHGGASKLAFDRIYSASATGDTTVATPDFEGAAGAYDIKVNGGASKVTVQTA